MKRNINDLALFGGQQEFSSSLYVGRPNIGDRDSLQKKINAILDRNWLTNNGPFVQEFEQKLAEMTQTKHCIAVSNGTTALEIAIRALDLRGEVIIPSFTFVATAHALQWQEITPVFCDINYKTHLIDARQIERLITPRTTGIIGVHTWGHPCDIDAICSIGKKYNLKVVFDAAHALGCTYRGKKIGSFGDSEIFSFHATKFINSFEGGAIATENTALAEKIRLMKNFGFSGYDNVIHIGVNGKMSEINAAMGLTSLESIEKFMEINYLNYLSYKEGLEDIPGVSLLHYSSNEKNNYQYIVVEIDEPQTGISRDQLIEILHSENIFARRYFYPGCHKMEPYKSYFPNADILLPETENLVRKVMTLPTGTSMSSEKVKRICSLIRFCIQNSSKLVKHFSSCVQ